MQTLTLTLTARDCAEAAGDRTDSYACVDCGMDTAPGIQSKERTEKALAAYGSIKWTVCENSEVYFVRSRVWEAANMDGWGGCLCIGCLETRLGREPSGYYRGVASPANGKRRDLSHALKSKRETT
jgi:hypothetical protein